MPDPSETDMNEMDAHSVEIDDPQSLSAYITDWKARHSGKIVGVSPLYFPPEIVDAAGCLPVGFWGFPVAPHHTLGAIQNFACSIVRTNLEVLYALFRDVIDAFIVVDSCDGNQNFSEIVALEFPHIPVIHCHLSVAEDGRLVGEYIARELERVGTELAKITGADLNDALIEDSIRRYFLLHKELSGMYEERRENPSRFTAAGFYRTIQEYTLLSPADFLKRLYHIISENAPFTDSSCESFSATAMSGSSSLSGYPRNPRIVFSGKAALPLSLMNVIDDVGFEVVDDDLALGGRMFRKIPGFDPNAGALDYLVSRIMNYDPCSFLHSSGKNHLESLKGLTEDTGADGVIFLRIKFCEKESLEEPDLVTMLRSAGIPSLILECDLSGGEMEPLRNRLSAFREMLLTGKSQGDS
jgi:benzoyl-CoA reductase/2-hydroxyglutaryl-CoA dehydratase subunit BcrC/BadD/HgdB